MSITIKGFIESSLIEWEGNIAAILFLPHCNMRCPYCHATHLVNKPNELESIPLEVVEKRIKKNKDWLGYLGWDILVSIYYLGILGKERVQFWHLLLWTTLHRRELFPLAVTLAVYGHHFRKVSELHVL